MANYLTKVGGIATALLALTITASAEIKLNDNISTSGYLAGSNRYTSQVIQSGYAYNPDGSFVYGSHIDKKDSFEVDAAKLRFDLNYKPVTGVVSLYHQPDGNVTILDAYVSYDAGHGISITGGKFQSWLGFEAFDPVDMYQISYANNDFLNAAPSYHSGVSVGYSDGDYNTGIAILDSVYSGGYLKGDGELRHNAGFEAHVAYMGIKDVVLWSGIAYESRRTYDDSLVYYSSPYYLSNIAAPSIVTLDFWASYQMDKATLFAVEYAHKNGDAHGDRGYNWLFLTHRSFTEKFSTAVRVSGEHVNSYRLSSTWLVQQPNFTKFTIAPAYAVTANLSLRGEISYYNYSNYNYTDANTFQSRSLNHSTYFAVQALFKF
jgi:hypothetical protein